MRWNNFLLAVFLGIVVELGAAALLAQIFADQWDWWPFFFTAAAILILVPIPLGLWRFVKSWLAFWAFERTRMKRVFLAYLYKLDFPSAKFHTDAEVYLTEIAADRIRPDAVRLAATKLLGELSATRDLQPFSRGIQVFIAFNDAIAAYDKPPSPVTDWKQRGQLAQIDDIEIDLDPNDLK